MFTHPLFYLGEGNVDCPSCHKLACVSEEIVTSHHIQEQQSHHIEDIVRDTVGKVPGTYHKYRR